MNKVRERQCTGCVSVNDGVRERQCTGCVSVSARGAWVSVHGVHECQCTGYGHRSMARGA